MLVDIEQLSFGSVNSGAFRANAERSQLVFLLPVN